MGKITIYVYFSMYTLPNQHDFVRITGINYLRPDGKYFERLTPGVGSKPFALFSTFNAVAKV